MVQQDDTNEKDDRQRRFQRRRSHVRTSTPDDTPRQRKTTPYKRARIDHSRFLDDEWDDYESDM
jgi:hypothetical protein